MISCEADDRQLHQGGLAGPGSWIIRSFRNNRTEESQSVLVRHVKTATKLAPLKTVSVCKLELNAGLMGARLAKIVKTALKREMDGRFFWTDSSSGRTVLLSEIGSVLSHHTTRFTSAIGLKKSRLSLSRMNGVLFLSV